MAAGRINEMVILKSFEIKIDLAFVRTKKRV